MRQPEPGGDPGRDGDGVVAAGRDDPVDLLGAGEPLDRRLVLDRDDRAPVGVAKARRGGVAVGRDDGEPAPACGLEHSELRGAGAEDEQTCHGLIVAAGPADAAGEPQPHRTATPRTGEAGRRPADDASRVTIAEPRSSRLLLVLAAGAYAGVFAAFVVFETPGLGLGHFFYLPICLVALATDEFWGAAGGVLGTGLYAAAVVATPNVPTAHLMTTSTGIRLLMYCGIGALVGSYARSNRRLVGRLVEHATHDFLTGVGNARAFDDCLARRCGSGLPFTLVLGDMDELKALNDVHGHSAGNDALRRVAAVFREHAGPGDDVARIGGDEFAILTSRPAEEAALYSTRLSRALSAQDLHLSFGVTSAPVDGTTAVELFRKADDRLFAAKLVSRNRRTIVALADA